MVESTVQAGVAAKHTAEQLGETTDAVQELGYAADVTGASAESVNLAMRRLAMGMEHARKTGSGPLVDAMQSLHVSFDSVRNKSPDQVLEALADGFQKAGPHVNKTAIAMELFGRQGAQLVPLLNSGKGGIEALRAEAQKLGVVMDKEAIEKTEEFESAQGRLGATLTGLRNTAVMALLPALQEMLEGLMGWVRENREAIAAGLEAVMRGIATAFKLVGTAISWATHFFQEHRDVAISALLAIGAVLSAFAIKAAISWALAFAPIALIMAGIAALILGLKRLAEYVTGGEVSWEEMWEGVKAGGEAIVDWFEDLPGRVYDFFMDVQNKIEKAFNDAFDFAIQKAKDAWEEIKHVFGFGGKSILTEANDMLRQQVQVQAGGGQAPSVPSNPWVASAQATSAMLQNATTINGGDIHITATGMDADQVKALATQASAEHLQDQIRQAHTQLGGAPQAMR
jgi:hypothetical protein